ncbi:MAG: hypothetical protein HY854_11030 [Burkholderiales bacterium]|nr:hypothetical protein [Burkholderiales bacterium]
MTKKYLFTLALMAACCVAQAQSTPAKKELIGRILKIQQQGIETVARGLAEEPAVALLTRAEQALPQRVPADRQQAVAKEIQDDAKKYLEEAVPYVRSQAVKVAPTTVGALLDKEFSEAELKQVLGFLESPAYLKFQKLGPDMQKVLVEKVVADTRGTIDPKIRDLESSIAKRLGVSAAQPAAAPASRR